MLDGWEPVETHEHYDAAGTYTGKTVVTRESPWDEQSVGEAFALHEARLLLCPDCGMPREVCEQRNITLYPQRSVCWSTATVENITRRFHDKHKDAKPDSNGFLPTDGVRLWVSRQDLSPDDDFL